MILMLLGLFFADASGEVKYADTNVFELLRPDEVAIAADGDVYILNFAESKVLHYDGSGKQLGSFGGKGEGPGEFAHPNKLFVDASHVYVSDLGRDAVHCFKRDGTFEKMTSLPGMDLQVVRVQGGWICANIFGAANPESPIEVTWVNDSFTDPHKILTLPRGPSRGLRIEMNGTNQRPVAKFNPVSDGPSLVSSPDGKLAYVRPAGGFHVYVIDAVRHEVLREIKRDEKGLPFNEEYGKARLAQIKEDMEKRHSPVTLEADFPKHFPAVREMSCDASGNLVIRQWSGQPDKIERYLILDPTGKELPLPCKPELLPRVVQIKGGTVYLNACPEDDTAYLVRVPLNRLEQAAKVHPYEGELKPRMLMRMN